METNPVEIVKEVTDLALNIGEFVLDRLKGGAWAQLPVEEINNIKETENV